MVKKISYQTSTLKPQIPTRFDLTIKATNKTTHLPLKIPNGRATLSNLRFTNGVYLNGRGDMLLVPAGVKRFTMFATPVTYGSAAPAQFPVVFGSGNLKKSIVVHLDVPAPTPAAAYANWDNETKAKSGDQMLVLNSEGHCISDSIFAGRDYNRLATLDSNHDGLIDLNDPQWQSLGIWQDANKDGIFQKSEFQTLAERGIAAIDLRAGALAVNDSLAHGLLPVLLKDGSASVLAIAAAPSA